MSIVFTPQFGLRVVGVLVTACVANYWLSFPAVIILLLLLVIRHYFLHASRHVQRLEALGNFVMRQLFSFLHGYFY